MLETLRFAQDLLAHAIPSADLAQVFDRALTVLVEDLKRKKTRSQQRLHVPERVGSIDGR